MRLLNENAQVIFDMILEHAGKIGVNVSNQKEIEEINELAYQYDAYAQAAYICNNGGIITKDELGNNVLSPAYQRMNEAYNYILSHSGKYGMTPADRERIMDMKPKNLN